MRLLFVYRYLTPGGVEAVLRARLEELPRHGVEAEVWLLRGGLVEVMFRGMEACVRVGSIEALSKHLSSRKPDVVVSIDTEEVFWVMDGAQGAALILEVHTPYPENLEYLRRVPLSLVQAVLVPSAYQAQVVGGRIKEPARIHVVPNPLARPFLAPLGPVPFWKSPPIVAWIGRLDPLKNWTAFLEIAAYLRTRREVSFWLVGDTPAREDDGAPVWKQLRSRGLVGQVRWFPSVGHHRVPRLLDVVRESGGTVISTSRGESFGMVVAEAMARGCAVVAPDRPPMNELIRPGESGILYPPDDLQTAVDCVEILLQDTDMARKMGQRACRQVLSRHHPDRAMKAYIRVLRDVSLC